MQEQMPFMQQDSIGAKKELCDYLKKARTEFTEHTIASAESITVMDHYLGLDMRKENDKLQDEFASTFSTLDANFVTRTNELHSAVNDSLMQDREKKEATDAILETSMKQVTLLQEKYGQAVYQRKNETPKKLAIIVPSLASIEEMRTLFPKNILSEDASSMEKRSTKQRQDEGNNRIPFLEVNI
ncbi:hypothetical protein Bca101_067572 [Brassica carinata]